MNKPKSVDEYIDNAPEEIQERLEQVRTAIKETVPEAEEKISYNMPYYSYKGRVAYLGYTKDHIGLYALYSEVMDQFKDEIGKRRTSKATLSFSLDEKLPIGLIKKLVATQAKLNKQSRDK